MTARATPVPARLLDDYTCTSHAHARDTLGGHRHAVPIGRDRRVRGGHAVAVVPAVPVRRQRVHDLLLLLGLDVYRHGLRIPVLSGLHVRPAVHVAVSTGRNSDCTRSRVLDRSRTINEQDQRIIRPAFRGQHPPPMVRH